MPQKSTWVGAVVGNMATPTLASRISVSPSYEKDSATASRNLVGEPRGIFGRVPRVQQDSELVTAEPRHQPVVADDAEQTRSELSEHLSPT